jgi:hypothetical protein
MSSRLRHLEVRSSLLALTIATAGASLHLAVDLTLDLWRPAARVKCPGGSVAQTDDRPDGASLGPDELESVEASCRTSGAARCDVARVVPYARALEATRAFFGDESPDQALLRFSPVHHRVVWTLRAHEAGLRADVDAFDAAVVEFAADGVTTN